MATFEHIVFRTKVYWDGMEYRIQVMAQKDWTFEDPGVHGWEFVSFVPNHEDYLTEEMFGKGEFQFVRLAIFKREIEESQSVSELFSKR